MDERRFDEFARLLGRSAPRRAALHALAGAVAGVAGWESAAAAGRNAGKRCDRGGQCCSGRCRRGTCARCAGGRVACARRCRDLQTDAAHCGACRRPCEDPRPTCCTGTCVDTERDHNHCGACGRQCRANEVCDGFGNCCIPAGGRCLGGDLDECCASVCRGRPGEIFGVCCRFRGEGCDTGAECCSGTCNFLDAGDFVLKFCD